MLVYQLLTTVDLGNIFFSSKLRYYLKLATAAFVFIHPTFLLHPPFFLLISPIIKIARTLEEMGVSGLPEKEMGTAGILVKAGHAYGIGRLL